MIQKPFSRRAIAPVIDGLVVLVSGLIVFTFPWLTPFGVALLRQALVFGNPKRESVSAFSIGQTS